MCMYKKHISDFSCFEHVFYQQKWNDISMIDYNN